MGANAAGAVQEARHGAVWRSKSDFRAASHPCCPRLSVGIPSQTMTSLPYKLLIVLFLISRRQFSPGSGKQERSVKPAHHVLDVKTTLPWLQFKAAPCFELKSCKMFHKRQNKAQVASSWTASMHDISTYITSRDSAATCTPTERLLVLGKHEKLENAALKENYRHGGAITDIIELVGPTVAGLLETVVARLWPPEGQGYLKVDCGGTLREWTFTNIQACWRVQLKPPVPIGFIFVADLNTLMLLTVYITHECLPALMAQIPLDVSSKSVRRHGPQRERNPEEVR